MFEMQCFREKWYLLHFQSLLQFSWYRDGAQAGHPRFTSQQEQQISLYTIASIPFLAPTQLPTQYSMGNGGSTRYVLMKVHN
jgi:hypothetical protein